MAHIIGSLYNKWRYYNFSAEDIKSAQHDVLRHNSVSLSVVCAVTSILILILSFYPYGNKSYHFVFYLLAALEFVGFLYSHRTCMLRTYTERTVVITFSIFIAGCATFSLLVYAFFQSDYVCRFLIVFLSFQIVFILGPTINLILNMLLALLFLVLNTFDSGDLIFSSSVMHSNYDVMNILIASAISMTLNWYIAHVVIKGTVIQHNLQRERNRFLEDSTHDKLTGLNNRRSYDGSVEFYTSVCNHVHQTVCVLMMDVDYFKNYNDFYGHQKGDFVLQSIGKVLLEMTEEEHLFTARVGGEEFIALWTENRIEEAERVVLKLRQKINDLLIPHEKSTVSKTVTASYGLYIMRGGAGVSSANLYNSADTALYKAKEDGRDRIVLLDSADGTYRTVVLRSPQEAGRK
ncbi:MAG: hypothetical protein Ta2G_19940 [Termitinemataceae bacterium]|nr:MAG: hypothetical protein Ta2G_19940 [Termitinemataceae bacterium]